MTGLVLDLSTSDLDRFWSKVDRRGPTECWPWLASINASRRGGGYGKFYVGGRLHGAHRVALATANGGRIDGAFVLHSCDNPVCCNPAHLHAGSHTANMREMHARGRACAGERMGEIVRARGWRGERAPTAKLTNAQAAEIRARVAAGERQSVVAASIGVSRATVCLVVNRKRWVE